MSLTRESDEINSKFVGRSFYGLLIVGMVLEIIVCSIDTVGTLYVCTCDYL